MAIVVVVVGGGAFHLFVHPCVSNDGKGDKQYRQNICFVF